MNGKEFNDEHTKPNAIQFNMGSSSILRFKLFRDDSVL